MPTAILLGLPKQQADRVKGQLRSSKEDWRQGWEVDFVPPTGSQNILRQADVRVAIAKAQACKDSPHVFGITNQGGRTKSEIAAMFIPNFRMRWLPGEWLALPYPSPAEFIEKLRSVMTEEDEWCQRVQPTDIAASLLLPSSSFTTKLRDFWDLATRFGEGTTTASARRAVQFEAAHWKPHSSKKHARKYLWTDDDLRIFDHGQDQHAEAPIDRRWKYSFKMPPCFHFDVRHANGREFTLHGAVTSRDVENNGYENLDSHGHFRGA